MSKKLLPCPFCGGDAEQDYRRAFRHLSGGRLDHGAAIYCTDCNADMIICRADCPELNDEERMAVMVENWNRRAAIADTGKVEGMLDWSNFDGPKRNVEWTPDDQDLIYTAINYRDDEYGDADEDVGQQLVERLLAAWQRSTLSAPVEPQEPVACPAPVVRGVELTAIEHENRIVEARLAVTERMIDDCIEANTRAKLWCDDPREWVREGLASALATQPSVAREQALGELINTAVTQKGYWFEKQKGLKSLEEASSENGEEYTPLGDEAAWAAGYANGRYSGADWFLQTIRAFSQPVAEARP